MKPTHALDEVGSRSFGEEVVMMTHQARGGATSAQTRKAGALAAFIEHFQKKHFIGSIGGDEDAVAVVATGHDVVKGSLVFEADLTRQWRSAGGRRGLSGLLLVF